MLILHGQLDYRVPYLEGVGSFTAFQRRGVPSRIVLFPDGIVDARISNQLSHLSSVVEEVIRGHFETTGLASGESEPGEDA